MRVTMMVKVHGASNDEADSGKTVGYLAENY